MRSLGGYHLDRLTVAQRRMQGRITTVHPGSDAGISDFGVDRIGEVDRTRSARQRLDVTGRRVDVDFLGEEIDLDALEKLDGVTGLRLDFQQFLDPLTGVLLGGTGSGAGGLLYPVGGDACFGHGVHHPGPNLKLKVRAEGTEHYGVQRLISVRFRKGDIVLELAWYRLVEIVEHAEHPVASVRTVHRDAKGMHVQHFGE